MDSHSSAVQIAGTGPAGLAAAITLADRGGAPVVFEKRADVGLRFHGDYQGLENWTTGKDVLEEFAQLGIEASFDHHPCRELVLFTPSGQPRVCRSAEPLLYLVRRGPQPGSLDQALKQQVLSRGSLSDGTGNLLHPGTSPVRGGVLMAGEQGSFRTALRLRLRHPAGDAFGASDRFGAAGDSGAVSV